MWNLFFSLTYKEYEKMLSMVVSTLRKLLLTVLIVFVGATSVQAGFHPRQYMCYRTSGSITIDGKLINNDKNTLI